MMKGNIRREQMLRLIEARGAMAVRDLVEQFSVSRMTIHRDLLLLEQEGRLSRLHGGVIRGVPQGIQWCRSCGQPVVPHQRVADYCCPHCALRNDPKPNRLIFKDFISGQPLVAAEGFFLMNSMVDLCCHPTILTFAKETEVIGFRAGFGGSVGRLAEALEFLELERVLRGKSGTKI